MTSNPPDVALNAVMPIRRDLKFDLDGSKINDWHYLGRVTTQLINGLSIMFPIGERFFITSVRNFRDEIDDPKLLEAVRAFIGQEAMHGREHEAFNQLMEDAGLPADELEKEVGRLLGFFQKYSTKKFQLGGTIALEHFTAILADALLSNDQLLGDSDAEYAALLRWHALEETEHKSVAFDVWNKVAGRGLFSYASRQASFVLSTVLILYMMIRFQRELLDAAPPAKDKDVRRKGARGYYDFLFGKQPGILRMVGKQWLDYFRPGFHPWDHDNREYLQQLPEIAAAYAAMLPMPTNEKQAS